MLWFTAACSKFLQEFRVSFPDASITPKMHLLEDHTLEWAWNWHAGFGLSGEQGAESIHARFNTLQRTFASMHDRLQHMTSVMREHLISIDPQNLAALPIPVKRPRMIPRD